MAERKVLLLDISATLDLFWLEMKLEFADQTGGGQANLLYAAVSPVKVIQL